MLAFCCLSLARPATTLAAATTATDALEAADDAAMGGDRTAIAIRKETKASTVDLFRQLGLRSKTRGTTIAPS